MNRQEKEQSVQALQGIFEESGGVFFVGYRGLTVAQTEKLRRQVRAQGGSFKVAKARLIKRACQAIDGVKDLVSSCKDQIALVSSQGEASSLVKVLSHFAKEHQALVIVAGCADKKVLSRAEISLLASLPSRDVLLAQLCGVLSAPIASVARTLKAVEQRVGQA